MKNSLLNVEEESDIRRVFNVVNRGSNMTDDGRWTAIYDEKLYAEFCKDTGKLVKAGIK